MTDDAPTRRARKGADEPLAPGVAPLTPDGLAPSPGALDDEPGRLPTAQLEMAAFGDHVIPYIPEAPPKPPSVAPWALGVTILALVASLFTGWLLPLGLVAVILSIVSLRRPHDSVRVAVWALVLSALSVAFSAGWLLWGFSQLSAV